MPVAREPMTPSRDDEVAGRSAAGARDGAWPHVSVVMAVRNEARHLQHAVGSVLAQEYPGPLDVTVALGPSHDGTGEVLAELGRDARVAAVDNPSGLTAAGLNAAIAASSGTVVARVDGHAVVPPGYLRRAVELLDETGADNVGGIMAAEGVTPFEQAVAAAMSSRFGTGDARFHYGGPAGAVDTVYLGVFRRSALERVGGFDETLVRAQDSELNVRIRETGGTVWFSPELRVRYRPRGSLRAVARQYFEYGRWRRVVARRHPGSLRSRQIAAPATVAACTVGTVIALAGRPWGWLPALGYGCGVVLATAVVGRALPLEVTARLPAVFATMHGAWGVGFLTSPRQLGSRAGPVSLYSPHDGQ
jgi:cellulose synthase/poly-beta-1,6-N-acetylglucosamine synthase-like glycosyltransferase